MMATNRFAIIVISIFFVSTCARANGAIVGTSLSNRHDHNIIHKDDNINKSTIAEFPIDEHSKIVAVALETTTETKKPPLFHRHEKKLTSIKHPLPPSWHDVMPYEPPRFNHVDPEKVHDGFIHHEGPILQRILHHRYTVEELRQRRKELREKLRARHNKMAHVTPHPPKTKEEEIVGMPTQSKPTTQDTIETKQEHHVLGKHLENIPTPETTTQVKIPDTTAHIKLEETSPTPSTESTTSIEIKEVNLMLEDPLLGMKKPDQAIISDVSNHISEEIKPSTSTPPNIVTEAHTEVQFIGLAPRMRKILEHVDGDAAITETSTKPTFFNSLKNRHRFSARRRRPTTEPPIETTTFLQVPQVTRRAKYILSSVRRSTSTTTVPPTTELDVVVTRKILPIELRINNRLVGSRRSRLTTPAAQEFTTEPTTEEPQMYQDWRAHLREAIKKRLHRLRQTPE